MGVRYVEALLDRGRVRSWGSGLNPAWPRWIGEQALILYGPPMAGAGRRWRRAAPEQEVAGLLTLHCCQPDRGCAQARPARRRARCARRPSSTRDGACHCATPYFPSIIMLPSMSLSEWLGPKLSSRLLVSTRRPLLAPSVILPTRWV